MVGPTVSGEVAWSVPATVRQDRWLSKTEPGLQTRLQNRPPPAGGGLFVYLACVPHRLFG